MKAKILIALLFPFMLHAQMLHVVAGQKTTAAPSAPAVYWKVNLADQYQEPTQTPAGWNTLLNTGGTAVTTAGGINATSLKNSNGTTTTVGFTNVTALNGTRSVPNGAGNGVFPDFIETQAWEFPNAGQVKFTGLDNAKQYTVYVHGNAQNWESGSISFTVGATTSSTLASTASNVGNATTYPNWETDPALIKITNITPTSGTITITVNVISGLGMVDAIVLKQQ